MPCARCGKEGAQLRLYRTEGCDAPRGEAEPVCTPCLDDVLRPWLAPLEDGGDSFDLLGDL